MRRLLCGLSLLPLLILTTGCASSGGPFGGSDSSLRREVDELKRRVLELQKKAAVSEVEIARLRERLIELEVADRQSADSGNEAREDRALIEPPRVIRIEDLDQPEEEPASTATAAADSSTEATESVDSHDRARAASRSQPVDEASAQAIRPTPPEGVALYDRGYTLYNQTKYVDAEASFQRFLQQFPDTELADNALYWIGESRFSRRDFRGALAAFRDAVRRYPAGNKVPDALLKAGRCLEELGDTAGARETYRELQRRFPDSARALDAADRIRALGLDR